MTVLHLHAWGFYQEFAELPDELYPCHISRGDSWSLFWVDPRATRFQVVAWCVENLTEQEQNAGRAAFGQPEVGQPLDDDLMVDGPVLRWVPSSIRTADYVGPEFPAFETETA